MTEINRVQNIFQSKQREIYWQLKEIGLEEQECQAEARLIIEHISGLKQAQQIINTIESFPEKWLHEITRIINLRRERRPLSYCLGEIEFAGLKYKIIPGVLIPRTDTETLIEAVVEWVEQKEKIATAKNDKNAQGLNIAEIGVGSGIIAISLLKRLSNCKVWACDISETAIATALGNARRHHVHERLNLIHGDWKKVLPNDFDVIVSNPPYVASSQQLAPELYFEPKEALFAGKDGLDFYRDFASILPRHYKKSATDADSPNFFGAFEIGDEQEESVIAIFKSKGWQDLNCQYDVNGLPRVIIGLPPTRTT